MNSIRAKVIGKVSLLSFLPLFAIMVACNTTQQRATFNTLASLEATATATMDGVDQAAIKGMVSTKDVATVSQAFNKFQAGFLVAIDLAQNNSNALAPDALNQELTDFLTAAANVVPAIASPSKTNTKTNKVPTP